MTCRATSAGAVQLESHEIEAWSMIQQVVSFSSAESEFYAIEAPNVDRRETLDHRRKQEHRIGANLETRTEDAAERAIQVVEKVPDKIDSLNKEAMCTRPVFADPTSRGREPPDKISQEQTTFENAKESPSYLDTKVLEREAMLSRVSKFGVVAVTGRFLGAQLQWSCFGFICGLAGTSSANDEVIVNGHRSKRVNGTTTGVMEATDSTSTFVANAGAGGAVARESAGAAQRWCAVCYPKAGNQEECASGRLACALCAEMCEAENVSQQEDSTGHGPRHAERAPVMLRAAMKVRKLQ